ncbi:MAG TPA: YHS domain-containing protein [Planctomycetota bacterium]|nr:YHS domain-containing protein [Planctomycetota bacterium]
MKRTILILAFVPLLLSACSSLSPSSAVVTSDPVCGAVVNRTKAIRKVYGGRDYYFDSEKCVAEFEAHPSSYAMVHLSRVGPR